MTSLSAWLASLAMLSQAAVAAPQDEEAPAQADDPVTSAWKRFAAMDDAPRRAILEQIEARLRADEDPALRRLLELEQRAAKELAIEPAPPPSFHDPAVYAPGPFQRGEVARAFAPSESDANPYYEQRFQVAAAWPPFPLAVSYDFGRNVAVRWRESLSDADRLWMLLWGHGPATDLAHAWICRRLDFATDLDPMALHFEHVYCDLAGTAYAGAQLYHAFSSTLPIDMPDVDVIAFARNVLKDRSYVSPIPASSKRERLYETIRNRFLAYYQYRTWIEAAATIYLDPEGRLRAEHEGLRGRLLLAFALDGDDLDKVRKRFEKAQKRDAWVEAMDRALEEPSAHEKIAQARALRAARRARITEHAHAVLRENALLREEPDQPVELVEGRRSAGGGRP